MLRNPNQMALLKKIKPPKYRNQRTTVDGLKFDSKKEAARWQTLKLLEQAGEILNLQRQVGYDLEVNGIHICKYVVDFKYTMAKSYVFIHEDVKAIGKKIKGKRRFSTMTEAYGIKKRLMRAIYGIKITELL